MIKVMARINRLPATMMQMMLTRLKRHAAKHQAIIVPRQRTTIFASKAFCNIVYILWNCREWVRRKKERNHHLKAVLLFGVVGVSKPVLTTISQGSNFFEWDVLKETSAMGALDGRFCVSTDCWVVMDFRLLCKRQ